MAVELDDPFLARLSEHQVFSSVKHGQPGWKAGDVIKFSDACELEPYCAVLNAETICSMIAFSYTWSPLTGDMVVGRHFSIGAAVTVPAPRHPVEVVTTSSLL